MHQIALASATEQRPQLCGRRCKYTSCHRWLRLTVKCHTRCHRTVRTTGLVRSQPAWGAFGAPALTRQGQRVKTRHAELRHAASMRPPSKQTRRNTLRRRTIDHMTNHRTTPPPMGSVAWLRWFRMQRRWRELAAQVRREEPVCWLRLPGCTGVSTTANHIIPAAVRPELAHTRSNLRGACRNCNSRRKDKHHRDPNLRRLPRKPSTATALKHIATRRQTPGALQFFNPN